MNEVLLEKAKQKISDPRKLVVIAERRVKQFTRGARPLVKSEDDNLLNVALQEIAEGLLSLEAPKKTKK